VALVAFVAYVASRPPAVATLGRLYDDVVYLSVGKSIAVRGGANPHGPYDVLLQRGRERAVDAAWLGDFPGARQAPNVICRLGRAGNENVAGQCRHLGWRARTWGRGVARTCGAVRAYSRKWTPRCAPRGTACISTACVAICPACASSRAGPAASQHAKQERPVKGRFLSRLEPRPPTRHRPQESSLLEELRTARRAFEDP
jgi:hypothetical protein